LALRLPGEGALHLRLENPGNGLLIGPTLTITYLGFELICPGFRVSISPNEILLDPQFGGQTSPFLPYWCFRLYWKKGNPKILICPKDWPKGAYLAKGMRFVRNFITPSLKSHFFLGTIHRGSPNLFIKVFSSGGQRTSGSP